MRTVKLKPFEGDVSHCSPAFANFPELIQRFTRPYQPPRVPDLDMPHAKAVMRAINRIMHILGSRQWSVIGHGYCGVVLGHSSHGYVLKLRYRPCYDDSWFHYARWAMNNRMLSPAVPRIDRLAKFESGPLFTYLAKMERLTEVTDDPAAYELVRDTAPTVYVNGGPLLQLSEAETPSSVKTAIDGIVRDLIGKRARVLDLRSANMMLRPNSNELVIIDPIM